MPMCAMRIILLSCNEYHRRKENPFHTCQSQQHREKRIRRIGAGVHLRLKRAVQVQWDDWVLNAPNEGDKKETINEIMRT